MENKNQQPTPIKRSNKPLIIFIILFVVALGTTTFFGLKYYQLKTEFSEVNNELTSLNLALLPPIDKIHPSTEEEYYKFITQSDFSSTYKLRLEGDVVLNYRDVKSTKYTAKKFGNIFSIAYIEKIEDEDDYKIVFAVPQTEQSVTYVYVTIKQISANLPYAATGSFVRP